MKIPSNVVMDLYNSTIFRWEITEGDEQSCANISCDVINLGTFTDLVL